MLTGSPLREVLTHYQSMILESTALAAHGLVEDAYLLASLHRQETVDSTERFTRALNTLDQVSQHLGLRILISTHPRTRDRLSGMEGTVSSRLELLPPFGYFDYCQLQRKAFCVLSDSGTVSEESARLGFPAVTLRAAIERPEAMETGSIVLAEFDGGNVLAAVDAARASREFTETPSDYLPSDVSIRVRNLILSTAPQHRFWSGLRSS